VTTRSGIMRAIKGKDTKPELILRQKVRAMAPGYRLNRRDIPGSPDIAFIGRRIAIFMHGCFWHGHDCKRGSRVPKDNRAYWTAKIARNRARDEETLAQLSREGWRTLVVWECELRDEAALEARLRALLA
jgi:DNA mismatch endonuclease (patch repair protein)